MQNIGEHQVTEQMNRHPILTKPNPHGYDQTAPSSHCHPMPTTRCNPPIMRAEEFMYYTQLLIFLLNPFY